MGESQLQTCKWFGSFLISAVNKLTLQEVIKQADPSLDSRLTLQNKFNVFFHDLVNPDGARS